MTASLPFVPPPSCTIPLKLAHGGGMQPKRPPRHTASLSPDGTTRVRATSESIRVADSQTEHPQIATSLSGRLPCRQLQQLERRRRQAVVKVERGRLGRRRQRHMEGGGGGDNVARTSACPASQRCNCFQWWSRRLAGTADSLAKVTSL